MKSNVMKFAQQGIWPTISGGWYYDSNHSSFANIFHLYTWLLLLCLPYVIYQSTSITWTITIIYSAVLIIIMVAIKLINAYLHKTFDEGEQMQKRSDHLPESGKTEGQTTAAEGHVRFDSEDVEAGDASTNSVHEKQEPVEPCTDAGHMQLWEELSRQGFMDLDPFSPTEDEKDKQTQADVHAIADARHQKPSTSQETEISTAQRKPRRRKGKVALDVCYSLPDASSSESDGHVPMKGQPQGSSSTSSADELEPASQRPTSTTPDDQQPQCLMQRKAGFRNRSRHKNYAPKTNRPSAGGKEAESSTLATGDAMFSGVDGAATPKEETRKRNAPKHDPLAPDHKRSFSTATVEVFHARDVEANGAGSASKEMTKRSSSLPATTGAGDSLPLRKETTATMKDKSSNEPATSAGQADNQSIASMTSSATCASVCSGSDHQNSEAPLVPPSCGIAPPIPEKKKISKTTSDQTSTARKTKGKSSASKKLPPSKLRVPDRRSSRKITVNDFIQESSPSAQCEGGSSRRKRNHHLAGVDLQVRSYKTCQDSTSSDEGEDEVLKFISSMRQSRPSERDGSSVPLLSGLPEPSSPADPDRNADVNRHKKVSIKASSQKPRKQSRNMDGRSSTEESETQNVEDNYQECLQNFNDMSSVERRRVARPSRAYHFRPPSVTTRHVAAVRSRSAEDPPLSRRSVVLSRRPPSSRHRHPAGQAKLDEAVPQGSARRRRHTDSTECRQEDAPSTSLSHSNQKLHLARDHADTTEGAVHTFQDELGNWLTYTFSREGPGVARELSENRDQIPEVGVRSRTSSSRAPGDSSSSASNREPRSTSELGDVNGFAWEFGQDLHSVRDRLSSRRSGRRPQEQQSFFDALRRSIDTGHRMGPPYIDTGHRMGPPSIDTSPLSILSQFDLPVRTTTPRAKFFYKVKILPNKTITIQYDRLALMDLLDRNVFPMEAVISIILVALVGFLGVQVLAQSLLHDLWTFWFCFVIATSQFSLIRSVQPDSASPVHGHNRVIAYSRPFYFALCTSLLLLFNFLADASNANLPGIPIYGVTFFDNAGCAAGRDVMLVITLLLPLIFLFGLLPQVNTFVMYVCEQMELHAFGGSASTSLFASVFSVGRSLLSVVLVYGFCIGGMTAAERSQHILFSAFCGLVVSLSHHLSRQISSPWILCKLIRSKLMTSPGNDEASARSGDPAQDADNVGRDHAVEAVSDRLQSDVIMCPIIALLFFAIHCSTVFSAWQPYLSAVLYILISSLGFLLHYVIPQARKSLPWLIFTKPLLKSREHDVFEVKEPARLMWFERFFATACFFERSLFFPLLILNELTREAPIITDTYGLGLGCGILSVIGIKSLRSSFSIPEVQYFVFALSILFAKYDARLYQPSVLITYFFFSILFAKDLVLKLHFWMVYVAPWQITWGSAFHAFAQPFAVPHTAFLTAHAILSSLLQAPFVPFLGSALFLASYVRPLKFWERSYKTKRIDHSNTRLSSQLDRGLHSDDNNLNSIFYEHLTYSLQRSLAGDICLGRWGNVYAGDCFILASDNLNALVHVIELANGLVTFQLRGLEFSGTYCQQREVEAINEDADKSSACCCCSVRRIKGTLSFNAAFNQRWLAWQVIVKNYVLDGYSISDNNATIMLGVFDLRKILINYIVKSIIFFLASHDSLPTWLEDVSIRESIACCEANDYADMDSTFAVAIDDDYDVWLFGVTRNRFEQVYGKWIKYCAEKRKRNNGESDDLISESKLITLSFAISVLGRRALNTAAHNHSANLDAFLYGLHSLFKGDFRITSPKDEWIFTDMNLLQEVVAPGVRTALKLHQDHFVSLGSEEYEQPETLYDAINEYISTMVITHEGDPAWRKAVLSNTPSLLALRRVVSDTFVDQYSVVTLNHRSLGFRIVKVNRECVRGLWAGQQSELVYLRNRNPERGSIQNAKQVLRNMINSSCDQPIGYPIYVSPLTSSFANTNQQLKEVSKVLFQPITFEKARKAFARFVACLRQSCSGSCNSGGSAGLPTQQSLPLQPLSMSRVPSGVPGQYHSSFSRRPSLQRSLQVTAKPPTPSAGGDKDTALYATSQLGGASRSSLDVGSRSRHSSSISSDNRSKRLSVQGSDLSKRSSVRQITITALGRSSDASLTPSCDVSKEPARESSVAGSNPFDSSGSVGTESLKTDAVSSGDLALTS